MKIRQYYIEYFTTFSICDSIGSRTAAVQCANEDLDLYSSTEAVLDEGKEKYIAIIVRMPEEVTNVANYKHPHKPEIQLSVIVSATQEKN